MLVEADVSPRVEPKSHSQMSGVNMLFFLCPLWLLIYRGPPFVLISVDKCFRNTLERVWNTWGTKRNPDIYFVVNVWISTALCSVAPPTVRSRRDEKIKLKKFNTHTQILYYDFYRKKKSRIPESRTWVVFVWVYTHISTRFPRRDRTFFFPHGNKVQTIMLYRIFSSH